jgi:predicted metalloprotease with PDZ domain
MKAATDSYPVIAGVEQGSSAASAGVLPGDKVVSVNGVVPRDILEWQKLVDADEVELMLLRGNSQCCWLSFWCLYF